MSASDGPAVAALCRGLQELEERSVREARGQSAGEKIAEALALAELAARLAAGSPELAAILRRMEEEEENRRLSEVNHGHIEFR